MKLIRYKKVIPVLANAFLGPISLTFYLNYGSSRNSLNESLLLYSLLWWIYFTVCIFIHPFKLHDVEVLVYWTSFWMITILFSFLINKMTRVSCARKYIPEGMKQEIKMASNNFFTFWLPVGCLGYFGYALARDVDSILIYYIYLWWAIWLIIWFLKQAFISPWNKYINNFLSILYEKREKSIINHAAFLLIYGCAYGISLIIACMKFFSLFFITGFYIRNGDYLNLF